MLRQTAKQKAKNSRIFEPEEQSEGDRQEEDLTDSGEMRGGAGGTRGSASASGPPLTSFLLLEYSLINPFNHFLSFKVQIWPSPPRNCP